MRMKKLTYCERMVPPVTSAEPSLEVIRRKPYNYDWRGYESSNNQECCKHCNDDPQSFHQVKVCNLHCFCRSYSEYNGYPETTIISSLESLLIYPRIKLCIKASHTKITLFHITASKLTNS